MLCCGQMGVLQRNVFLRLPHTAYSSQHTGLEQELELERELESELSAPGPGHMLPAPIITVFIL